MNIRLAGICPNTLVNGEGMRKVIFTQGCRHNCKGCFNPETHSFDGGELYDCNEVILSTIKDPLIKGVTFSGGDPMEQALSCAYIAKALKNRGLNIWSFTGYRFEELINSDKEGVKEFLEYIDILVDGKFEESLQIEGLRFKGSSNQRIIDVQESLRNKKVTLYKPEIYDIH